MKKLIPLLLLCIAITGSTYAQPQISGNQTGTLGPGDYLVVGDITVPAGQTLTIMPGTNFLHNGHWYWYVYGQLSAQGTVTDSIKFKRQQEIANHRWGGIRFQQGANASTFDYCVIDNAVIPTGSSSTYKGGGIHSNGVRLSVLNSRISYCESYWGGAGMYVENANNLLVENCVIVDNFANADNGGGVLLYYCTDAVITNCIIARNSSTGG